MSIINYEKMHKTTDIRVVKTRRAIFRGIVQLMAEKDYMSINITELCRKSVINRKTFYAHYNSITDVFDDFENHIVCGFIDTLVREEVVTNHGFDSYRYIMVVDTIVEENRRDFDIIYPLIKSGSCLRKLGAEVGKLAFHFMEERPGYFDTEAYPFSLVFAICGLFTSYLDWIDFGRQFPIENLAEISTRALSTSLNSILSPSAGGST